MQALDKNLGTMIQEHSVNSIPLYASLNQNASGKAEAAQYLDGSLPRANVVYITKYWS
jgi:hypothetical protein